jgi:hypothetical protein
MDFSPSVTPAEVTGACGPGRLPCSPGALVTGLRASVSQRLLFFEREITSNSSHSAWTINHRLDVDGSGEDSGVQIGSVHDPKAPQLMSALSPFLASLISDENQGATNSPEDETSMILLLQSLYSFLKWMPLQTVLSKNPSWKQNIRHLYSLELPPF